MTIIEYYDGTCEDNSVIERMWKGDAKNQSRVPLKLQRIANHVDIKIARELQACLYYSYYYALIISTASIQ